MTRPCSKLISALALTLISSASFADEDRVQQVTLGQNFIIPPIQVTANQSGYVSAQPSEIQYIFQAFGLASQGNYIRASELFIRRLANGYEDREYFQWTDRGKTRLEEVLYETLGLGQAEKALAIQACSNNLRLELAAGKSKATVLSQEHVVNGPALYQARYQVWATPLPNAMDWLDMEGTAWITLNNAVRCLKAPFVTPDDLEQPAGPRLPPGPQDLAQEFGVTALKLWATPASQTTKCPANLSMNGEIHVNGPGTVKYRVKHNGALGPVSSLSFSKAGAKNVHQSITVKAGSTGDEAVPGGGSGIGGLVSGPANQKSGYFEMVLVSPDAGRKSPQAHYQVVCGGSGLPDLRITEGKFDHANVPGAGAGANQVLEIEVRNIGDVESPASWVEAAFFASGRSWAKKVEVSALEPGQAEKVTVAFSPNPLFAPTTIRTRVDPDQDVDELKEDNNLTWGQP